MARRDGGAHGVWHTSQTLNFCRCSGCVKLKREALLNPENKGKTEKQLVHEGKFGYQRGNYDRRPVPDQMNAVRQEAAEQFKDELEARDDPLPESAPWLRGPQSYYIPQVPPVTFADFMPAARTVAKPIHGATTLQHGTVTHSAPSPVMPAPAVPVAVRWPAHRPPTSPMVYRAPAGPSYMSIPAATLPSAASAAASAQAAPTAPLPGLSRFRVAARTVQAVSAFRGATAGGQVVRDGWVLIPAPTSSPSPVNSAGVAGGWVLIPAPTSSPSPVNSAGAHGRLL
ncbi:unnamed protein product [Polarella glacialis]|uniref:Uncharacterized protein n=1 Tax=Polarella glacialis TaxID=89957 RepID=A0A813IGX6_POLGL|nr:unnamed protein product [Polarella glacialis]CAE8650349.1 unnamed protein product [Polarella glacialis]